VGDYPKKVKSGGRRSSSRMRCGSREKKKRKRRGSQLCSSFSAGWRRRGKGRPFVDKTGQGERGKRNRSRCAAEGKRGEGKTSVQFRLAPTAKKKKREIEQTKRKEATDLFFVSGLVAVGGREAEH